ncbi:MAG: hypothetical protein ACYS17_06800 [Planctomycetota bacterium]
MSKAHTNWTVASPLTAILTAQAERGIVRAYFHYGATMAKAKIRKTKRR